MNNWLKDIANLFFPAVCHCCGESLAPHERFLCGHCVASLPRTGFHRQHNNPMEQRIAGQFPFIAATGHFFYSRDSTLSQLIQDMKYHGFRDMGKFLGHVAAQELYSTGFFSEIEMVVPVPMHFIKKAKRGYNQTDMIAKGISEVIGVPVVQALKMNRQRKSQTYLSREERLYNAENLFSVRKNMHLNHKNILVVDDICTTGTTIASASKAITDKFPESRLYLFTLGVTF